MIIALIKRSIPGTWVFCSNTYANCAKDIARMMTRRWVCRRWTFYQTEWIDPRRFGWGLFHYDMTSSSAARDGCLVWLWVRSMMRESLTHTWAAHKQRDKLTTRVSLTVEEEQLAAFCTLPVWPSSRFCKHIRCCLLLLFRKQQYPYILYVRVQRKTDFKDPGSFGSVQSISSLTVSLSLSHSIYLS